MKIWKLALLLRRTEARFALTILLLSLGSLALAADLVSVRADRAAIERVYYNHRLGEKLPFEQVLPQPMLEQLVQQDLAKEAVLSKAYGIAITPAMLNAEVQRINTSTRAPQMLAEIKAALGNDPVHFANSFSKPILVERLLREKFDNDDMIHASLRRHFERARNELLAAKTHGADYGTLLAMLKREQDGAVTETTWQLAARLAGTYAPGADEIEIKKRFGPNAQMISPPRAGEQEAKYYFEDLPAELQNVLRVQLQKPGDVSAVVELPSCFQLFLAKERTAVEFSLAVLSLPKRGYEEWLAEQAGKQP